MLKKFDLHSQKRRVLFFTVILFALAFVGLSANSVELFSRQSSDKSLTQALQLVSTTVVEDRVRVSLKNISTKNINGMVIDVNGSSLQIEFLDASASRQQLSPGAVYEEWFALQKRADSVTVSVLAVTFDDSSSDGDAELVKQITDTRLGVKKQLLRFQVMLKAALASKSEDGTSVLAKLKSEIENLPSEDVNDSLGMKLGQRKAKEQIRHDIELVERLQAKGTMDVFQALANTESRQENRLRKLP